MPRGKSGRGGMGKRTRKTGAATKRELWYKEEGQEYAQVQSMLGNLYTKNSQTPKIASYLIHTNYR